MHASNVAYEQLQADAEETHAEIENLRDELAKAHATIDKLSNALVDRL
jgi:cell division septum initiation protein DivIVA